MSIEATDNHLECREREHRLRDQYIAIRDELADAKILIESLKAQLEANHEWEACAENEAVKLRAEVKKLSDQFAAANETIRVVADERDALAAKVAR